MNIIQEWMTDSLFSLVIQAEFVVDIFFWITAFLASYLLLVKLKETNVSLVMVIVNRIVRLWPSYAITLLISWKIMSLFGGEGPMFFMYEQTTNCSKLWFWHLTFLNNIVPWGEKDTCMPWTWYIANEMQFYLTIPLFVPLYYSKRMIFYFALGLILVLSIMFQVGVILKNDLSVSYFTYKDEYWTVYYIKPYSRIPAFLVGMLAGCSYYSFKHEDPDEQRIAKILEALQFSKVRAMISHIVGVILMNIMTIML